MKIFWFFFPHLDFKRCSSGVKKKREKEGKANNWWKIFFVLSPKKRRERREEKRYCRRDLDSSLVFSQKFGFPLLLHKLSLSLFHIDARTRAHLLPHTLSLSLPHFLLIFTCKAGSGAGKFFWQTFNFFPEVFLSLFFLYHYSKGFS